MENRRISVILPCYNVERWIGRCLQSIVNQTIGIESMEIICVDDKSNDSTISIIKEWENKYPDSLILIECSKNGRQGQARNIGLEYASGEWIGFIDSDDWIEPNYFEKMLAVIDSDDIDMVCCESKRDFSTVLSYFNDIKEVRVIDYNICNEEARREVILSAIFKYNAWGKIIRKDFLIENDLLFWPNITYEDAGWGSLVHLYVKKVKVINENLYHYFVNDESTVLTKNSNHHLDCLTVQTKVWNEYKRRGFYDKFKYELEIEHIYSAYLPAMKALILRYEKPDYNVYLLLRELMLDRIGDYMANPYVQKGMLSELHMLILTALTNQLNRNDFYILADNIIKIGI